MYTTTFRFEEGSPYITNRRPVGLEIQTRLRWQAERLRKKDPRAPGPGLVVYTPIPAYIHKPTTIEVYWDFECPDEYETDLRYSA
ncbi:hypothetical protein OB13_11365 [Pontibacter sp. HJ8]